MSVRPPFPLGAYIGGLNGNDPAAEASATAQYTAFAGTFGAAPQLMDVYVDYAQPVSAWVANAGWAAWSWTQSGLTQGTIPVIGLPMATAADGGNPDPVFRAFIAGTYDATLRGIVTAWAQRGFSTLYIRPGYEFDVGAVPWFPGSSSAVQGDFVAAFQHIATVVRSVPNTDVKVVWNPNIASGNAVSVPSLYPGDAAVDVMAGDIYSPTYPWDLYDWARNDGTYDTSFAQWAANPVNRTHYWSYPDAVQYAPTGTGGSNSFSLQNMIDFARAHNKPIGIAETGAGGDGTRGPADDPAFPQWLAATLANSGAKVDFVNIWDVNPGNGNWDFSSPSAPKPLEAAAWAKYFGAQTPSVGSGPDTIVMDVSEDAYLGDAQFSVSVDGVAVSGVLTATQSHAAGATQAIDVLGSFGAGAHIVTVRFLNDAYGGGPALDRNLYVDSVQYGAATQPGAALYAAGAKSFAIAATSPAAPAADTLSLRLSEDAYLGDARFSVTVDGQTQGPPQAVAVAHGSASQTFAFTGHFGAGAHQVGVSFLNDAYGGSPALDRNLYVDGVAIDGVSAIAPQAAEYANGTAYFTVPASGAPDTLIVHLSEDAWAGDAACLVTIDGTQVGGVQTITASHALGQSNQLAFSGNYGPGPHVVGVQFINDAYGGPGMDRNLYLDSIDYDGVHFAGAKATLMANGLATYTIPKTAGATNIEAAAPIWALVGQN